MFGRKGVRKIEGDMNSGKGIFPCKQYRCCFWEVGEDTPAYSSGAPVWWGSCCTFGFLNSMYYVYVVLVVSLLFSGVCY